MKTLFKYSIALIVPIFMASCDNDDDALPEVINEEEVITTMAVTLTPTTGNTVLLSSQDLDGDGPDEPLLVVSGAMQANTTYSGRVTFLNETENPAENITLEVVEEGEEHQVFYQIGSGLNATVTYDDADSDGNPIGVDFTLTTAEASSGIITVTLRHEPQKDAAGVAEGDIANAGGETDFTATFSVAIE